MLVQARSFAPVEAIFPKFLTQDKEEQQLRFAFLQVGQVFVLATGNIANFGVGNPQ